MFHDSLENSDTPNSESEALYDVVVEEERKKYFCKYAGCGKVFRYKSEIARHAATHSESRPYVCQYDNCFKAFKRNDALENHIRSFHTKETPFACPFPDCSMKFATHGSFRYHVLKHNKQYGEGENSLSYRESLYNASQQRKLAKLNSNPESQTPQIEDIKNKEDLSDKLNLDEEFYIPPPKFAGQIKWEVMNDDTDCPSPNHKSDEPSSDRFDAILEENKMLKQKLNASENVIKGMKSQINQLLTSLFVYQSQMGQPQRTNLPQQPQIQTFPSSQNNFYQESFQENKLKWEEPLHSLPSYAQVNNLGHMPEPPTENEGPSIDMFLSFGKDPNSFGYNPNF